MAAPARAEPRPSADDVHRVISAAFDPAFYRAIHTDLPPDMGPLWHYRMQGWREGRDPAPWFSSHAYLTAYPDVKRLKVDPFFHYLTRGRHEGRDVLPSDHARAWYAAIDWSPQAWSHTAFGAAPSPGARMAHAATPVLPVGLTRAESDAAVARHFDAAFYLAVNPDVAASGMDPLEHFLITGWLEGRDPSTEFSVRDYLDANPDVAASGLNPFAHYVVAGRAEGRAARHDLGYEFDVIARLRPLDDRIAAAVAASATLAVAPAEVLARGLEAMRPDMHLTFSHDNVAENSGGLQMCVRREGSRFAELGRDHLHLYPAAHWPTVRAPGEPGPLGVLLNGRRLGVFEPEAVRTALSGLAPGGRRSFAVHSLLGHDADATAGIVEALGLRAGFFWLHDFASLCAGFHLQRNDVVDCGGPPPESPACGVCVYGGFRARHLDAHRRLFERLALTVVAPSETTLMFWQARTDLPARATVVLPHARLVSRGATPKVPADRPLRVAFLGMPAPLKGWPIFRDLARAFADDPRYEFLHLGGRPDPSARAAFHPVTVTAEQPKAMQDTVEALEIDAALIWPLCRETFSFTAYEAAAGGAMVITGPDSGNVAAFAAGRGRGRVLPDAEALTAAFASGQILALGRARRAARRYDLAYSGMTGDLVA
jgi:hypothetical protein